MLSLLLLTLWVSPFTGYEPLPVKVRFKLDQPTEYKICINFDADGAVWSSCWDGEPDKLFYEKQYRLDAGNYQIWVTTRNGQSEKRPVKVLESR